MNSIPEIISILTSPQTRLACTQEEYISALLYLLPAVQPKNANPSSFNWEPPTYAKIIKPTVDAVKKTAEQNDVCITTEYDSDEVQMGSLAYYRIQGMIMSDSYWWFSTKEFEQQLLAADANPNINAHFLHISSGGGEAWYLDRLHETMANLQKPVYTLMEKYMCSAAYYIGVHGQVIKSVTQNCTAGSIGTMVSFWDVTPYFKSIGIKIIEEYATKSTLKNKRLNNLLTGKPKDYIEKELDPLQQQFENNVRASRAVLKDFPEDSPVFAGESYYATLAMTPEVALIDGLSTLPEALIEANTLGQTWADKNARQNTIVKFFK